jgi:hypothetical protein
MSGSMKKRHTEEWIPRTSRGVASRMSLRHLPTNAGQGRPAEFSGAVAANRSTAFGASGAVPRMGCHAWDRGGSDDSRLLRIGSYFLLRQSGLNPLGLLFLIRPMVIG